MEDQTITFEEFLKTNWQAGFIDYTLKCYNDGTHFYIIPDTYSNINQTTPRYRVVGDSLLHPDDTAKRAINMKVSSEFLQFPTTSPKFFLGQKVYDPELNHEVVITAMGRSPDGIEWWYEVEHPTMKTWYWVSEEGIIEATPSTDKPNLVKN